MSPVDRRANERAMHETFLVIKACPSDMGSRPLTGPFTSPDLTVGQDGRPRAVVWNLGTREVEGVVTEFASVPAGLPVKPENRRIIGYGNPAIIPANSCVTVGCTSIWPRFSTADVLIVSAYHENDPLKAPYEPLTDRHVGQMNYAWSGRFEGKLTGPHGYKTAVEIRPSNKGLYRVRLFLAVNGRLPSNPQIDRFMAPTAHVFRWQEHSSNRKEEWELSMADNQRMLIRYKSRMPEVAGKAEAELAGHMDRFF